MFDVNKIEYYNNRYICFTDMENRNIANYLVSFFHSVVMRIDTKIEIKNRSSLLIINSPDKEKTIKAAEIINDILLIPEMKKIINDYQKIAN